MAQQLRIVSAVRIRRQKLIETIYFIRNLKVVWNPPVYFKYVNSDACVSERVKGKCRNELWDVIRSTIDCNIANFNETFSEVSQVLDDIGFTAESQNNVKNWVPVGLGKN